MSYTNLKLFALSSNQELAAKLLIKLVLNLEDQVFVNFQMVRFKLILKSLFVVITFYSSIYKLSCK